MDRHAITKLNGSEDEKKETRVTRNFFTVLLEFLMLPSMYICWQYPDRER